VNIELLANSREPIGKTLGHLLSTHSEAFFAVAYGTHSAFRQIERSHALQDFLKKGARLRAVFDIERHFTDPELIDELCTIPGDIECRMYAPRIRRLDKSAIGPAFHPKIYYFDSKGHSAAIVGSGNFTRGGLAKNHEVAMLLDGRRTLKIFKDLRNYLEDVWSWPHLISLDQYERFRDAYAKAYRDARARQDRPGVPDEVPLHQMQQDVDHLRMALATAQKASLPQAVAYVLGLLAGGGHAIDRRKNQLEIELRRGVLNQGKPQEGKVFFEGISERSFEQADCVRRDAERIVDRLNTSFRELSTAATVSCEQRGPLAYRVLMKFPRNSSLWLSLRDELRRVTSKTGRYSWPTVIDLRDPEVRRAFLQGYMDLRTRITATDRLPDSYTRIAVSVGGKATLFAEQLRDLMADEFACPSDRINFARGSSRGRENMLRIDARLVPVTFLRSHWQRIVVSDFRDYNRQFAGLRQDAAGQTHLNIEG